MTLQRILLAVLCLSLLCGFAAANVVVKGTDTLYVIKKTAVAPVIDGVPDNVWRMTDAVWQTSYRNGNTLPVSWEDLSGWSKLLWDDNNLYGLFYVQDDVITNLATNDWERDAVEVYLDGDLSRGPSFDGVNDVQFVIKHYFKDNPSAGVLTHGATYAIQDDTTTGGTGNAMTAPSGYWIEFQVPLDQVGIPATPETIIGLEFQQDDNDDNLVRKSISKWYLQNGDDSWQVPAHWGKAILSGEVVSDAFILNKLPDGVAAPVLDGAIDDIYRMANQVTQERRGNGNEFPVSGTDFFWRFYGLWDDNNLYGLVEIYDDIITNTATNDWERDAAEVYVDGDNSKGPSFDGVNDWQTVIKHYFKDTPPAPFSRGVTYAFLDVAQADTSIYPPSGYNIEFRMPLDQAGVPAAEGTVVGFEVQGDDNDNGLVRKNVTKWWLNNGDDSWQVPAHWGTAILGPAAGTVGIKQLPNQVATRFNLAQNYPNPFNPTTTITYSVIKSEKVRLTVYNVLGVRVADLVNETKAPGTYTVNFNASNLASGVYFYKLENGSNTMSKKMMLLK